MIVKHGNVLLFEEGGFVLRDIRVENGKIKEIAPELQAAEGEEVFDASGKYVTPGMIDAHSHICISEEGMGSIGDDCCDYSGALTPELEVLDGIYPFDRAVIDSVRAGVTAACVCPGSDGVVGGVASTITLNGTVADEMLLRRYTAMKCSVGENPKAAATMGLRVHGIKYCGVLICGALAGVGGAYLSLDQLDMFVRNMTAGRGYIAVAIAILGRYNPAQIVPCALLFGFCDAVQIYLQGEAFPPQIVQMLPYIVTLLVLAFGVKHIKPPAGVGKYDDE